MSVDVDGAQLTWADNSVAPETAYSYVIAAHDERGNFSDPSRPVHVTTLPVGGEGPTAPKNLHSMGQTAQSVSLMWGASTGTAPIMDYLIYRDDIHIKTVGAAHTSFDDSDLTPNTQYRYAVKARDLNNKLSLSSNVLSVRTQADGGEHPAWKLGNVYAKNDVVSHAGQNWACLQAHTAHVEEWAPGMGDNVLWKTHA
jgi:chitin-binding protein